MWLIWLSPQRETNVAIDDRQNSQIRGTYYADGVVLVELLELDSWPWPCSWPSPWAGTSVEVWWRYFFTRKNITTNTIRMLATKDGATTFHGKCFLYMWTIGPLMFEGDNITVGALFVAGGVGGGTTGRGNPVVATMPLTEPKRTTVTMRNFMIPENENYHELESFCQISISTTTTTFLWNGIMTNWQQKKARII